ncbi:MAG: valine--tRNA ligase [Microgenomates group bacterium]
MESKYTPSQYEQKLSAFWEQKGFFKGVVEKGKKPFSIVLPPPNANADLHLGHAMMVYEDIMIRYHKIQGDNTWWVYGTDHAGIETQFVFEKHLKKEGKSRFDFERNVLFQMIFDFVAKNKNIMQEQLKKLGFGLDYGNPKFPMDENIVKIVHSTFKKLFDDGLTYRAKKLVNYCVSCGTSFSDLEVNYEEKEGLLWYISYPLRDGNGSITVATTRPETMLGDTGIAVHPKDKRYKKLIGSYVILPLIGREIQIVADESVDPKFGTGAVKVTPAHDHTDWETGKRHGLFSIQVIGTDGKMTEEAGQYAGLTISKAREAILASLKEKGLLVEEKAYTNRVGKCYRCKRVIEPLPKEQWFISIKPLAGRAIEAVKKGEVEVYPKRFKKELIRILDNFIDWNISRQIVWGIRIPAYKCEKMTNDRCRNVNGWFVSTSGPTSCPHCGSESFKQDEDTFDTWFSSGQWPFVTLMTSGDELYNHFYPTTVMETGHDILRAWVARMLMLGLHITGKVPFKTVFLHGLVRDKHGQKMSKSKGNVVNPLEVIKTFGADVLRASLMFETKEGSDVVLTDEKMIGMRNFGNKLWNIGRFIYMNRPSEVKTTEAQGEKKPHATLVKLEKEFEGVKKNYSKNMDGYKFGQVLGDLHAFIWHRFADIYIEELKEELKGGNVEVQMTLEKIYLECTVLLHPFIPFETEAIWQVFKGENESILNRKV